MSSLSAAANVCGLWEMCYQELVNIVLAETHTRESQKPTPERTAYVTWFTQSNHIPHALRAPEKSDGNSQISHLPLCFLLPLPVKKWGGRGERGVGIFYQLLLGSLSICFYSIVLQRTRIEARDDIVVKGSTLSHTWSDTNLFNI